MGNYRVTNYDTSKTFIWNNRFDNGTFTAAADIVLPMGTVMGRISATGKLIQCKSDASDGSQYPVGILAEEYTVANGVSKTVSICIGGDVASEKIVFAKAGDTLETVIEDRRFRDRLSGDTLGIKIVVSTELTGNDNQ